MGHKEWFIIQIKRLKFIFVVPIVFLFIIQPVYLVLTRMVSYGGFGKEYLKDAIIGEVYYLYPMISLVWSYFFLSKYIEDEDRELSYFYNKIKLNFYHLYYNFLYHFYYILIFFPFYFFSFQIL